MGGVSALISPDGLVLVKSFGGAGSGSWEFEIDMENASTARMLEGMRVKNEWIELVLGVMFAAGGLAVEVELRGRHLGTKGKILNSLRAGFSRVVGWRGGAERRNVESDPLISFD